MPSWEDYVFELRTRFTKNEKDQGKTRSNANKESDGRSNLEQSAKLLQRNQQDNLLAKLHYQVTSVFLVFSCIVVTSYMNLQRPITCTGQTFYSRLDKEDIAAYCLQNARVLLPEEEEGHGFVPAPNSACWFQWSGLLLLLQATCFYLPNLAWKHFDRSIVNSVVSHMSLADVGEDQSAMFVTRAVAWFSKSKTLHYNYFCVKLFCDSLYLFNSLGQCVFINYLFNGLWSSLLNDPINTISNWLDYTDFRFRTIFPKHIECTLKSVGPSGTIQQDPLLCTASINYLNDRLHFLLMIWMTILLFATITGLFLKWRFLIIPTNLIHGIESLSPDTSRDNVLKLLKHYQLSGSYVLLVILNKMSAQMRKDFMDELCKTEMKTHHVASRKLDIVQ